MPQRESSLHIQLNVQLNASLINLYSALLSINFITQLFIGIDMAILGPESLYKSIAVDKVVLFSIISPSILGVSAYAATLIAPIKDTINHSLVNKLEDTDFYIFIKSYLISFLPPKLQYEHRDWLGNTALHRATYQHDIEEYERLLKIKHGDLEVQNSEGMTVIDLGVNNSNPVFKDMFTHSLKNHRIALQTVLVNELEIKNAFPRDVINIIDDYLLPQSYTPQGQAFISQTYKPLCYGDYKQKEITEDSLSCEGKQKKEL